MVPRLTKSLALSACALFVAVPIASAATYTGTDAVDNFSGTKSADIMYGFGGNDWLYSSPGNDLQYGGAGNDLVDGGNGADKLFGEAGDDHLNGSNASNDFDGSVDILDGGDGNDTLQSTDADQFSAGEGNDSLIIFLRNAAMSTVSCGGGTDTLTVQSYSGMPLPTAINIDCEDITLDYIGSSSAETIRLVTPTAGSGASIYFTVFAKGGNDTINGSSSSDEIQPGLGADVVKAGGGDDRIGAISSFDGDARGTVDTITCGAGYDRVEADRSDIVASDCESVTYA